MRLPDGRRLRLKGSHLPATFGDDELHPLRLDLSPHKTEQRVTSYLPAELAALAHIEFSDDEITTIDRYAVDHGVTCGAFQSHPDCGAS